VEDPAAQEQEAQERGHGVGRDQDGDLEGPGGPRRREVQERERAARHREPDEEDAEPLELVAAEAPAPADAEREPAVGRRVGDRGQEEGDGVRPLGPDPAAQQQVEQDVGERARDADDREAPELTGQAARAVLAAGALQAPHEPAAREVAAQAGDPAQVLHDGGQDVDPAVGVVHPVDRHLVDAHAGALGHDEHLGVEEPGAVLDQREDAAGDVGADGLEAALRVAHAGAERRVQHEVVAPGDDLPPRAADDAGAVGAPGPDRQVAVPAHERRDQGEQPGEVGREVDVHVGEDAGVARLPHLPERPAAALALEPHRADPRELLLEPTGERPGAVGAGVVGDRDPRGEREGGLEERVQAADARLEVDLLVVHGDDDVDDGPAVGIGDADRLAQALREAGGAAAARAERGGGGEGSGLCGAHALNHRRARWGRPWPRL
jgi:hypothetical protein